VLHTQVDPLVNQTYEPPVGHDLAAKLLHPFLADVLRIVASGLGRSGEVRRYDHTRSMKWPASIV